jgi:enoyl-[acyl-carrier protein] reductase II
LRRAVVEGDVENGSLMAGQSVGMVAREEPTRAILDGLVEQAVDALVLRARSGMAN